MYKFMDGSSMPGAGNIGNDAKKINSVIGSTVKFNIDILKYITQNAAVYAASLVTVPQYFRAVTRLYTGYGKFVVKNALNIAAIKLLSKPLLESSEILQKNISTVNDTISLLLPLKDYLITTLKTPLYFKLLNDIYGGYGKFAVKKLLTKVPPSVC